MSSIAPVVPLQRRKTLSQAKLRVVKRWPDGLVLTDGKTLGLWQPCDRYARFAVTVQGQDFAYSRRVRGHEL